MDTVQARSKGSASMIGRVVFKSSVLPCIDGEGILTPLCGSHASLTFSPDIRLRRCFPHVGGGSAPASPAGRTNTNGVAVLALQVGSFFSYAA